MQDIVNIIATFGFPIAACVAMGVWVRGIIERQQKQFDTVIDAHKEESREWQNVLAENTKALNDLKTVIMQVRNG